MQKTNYQLMTDAVIGSLSGVKKSLLLHACCAPCATYVLEYLSKFFDITVFFCNPNITNPDEYKKRLEQLYKLCGTADFCQDVKIVEDTVQAEEYFKAVREYANEREGGKRCSVCFALRMDRTARYAAENGFDYFATTLTVSPHKNAQIINDIGFAAQELYGIEYLPSDFKKRDGFKRSIVLSEKYGLYRQQYCGCVYSEQNG